MTVVGSYWCMSHLLLLSFKPVYLLPKPPSERLFRLFCLHLCLHFLSFFSTGEITSFPFLNFWKPLLQDPVVVQRATSGANPTRGRKAGKTGD